MFYTFTDDVREKTLRFLGADPEHFDLVFTANATAAIKLVADSFRDLAAPGTFWYGEYSRSSFHLSHMRTTFPVSCTGNSTPFSHRGLHSLPTRLTLFVGYHKDAHTSLVGVRELTAGTHHCFSNDREIEEWLKKTCRDPPDPR